MKTTVPDDESFRDSISTVDKDGNRIWVYPKKTKGKFYNYRTYLSWLYLVFFFSGPFIRIGGEPLLMMNILERKFVILGQIFWPQDSFLFVMAMITFIVFIIVFTVAFGRLFCGWICPQTIFMEMVFRKVEYFIEGDYKQQMKLNKQPWDAEKIRKKTVKHLIFLAMSFLVGNTFLAYIIGSDTLIQIMVEPPSQHIGGLLGMVIFSAVFYGVFAFFREQVCTTVCPYGRLQGVLLDRSSIIVAYDKVRGEIRSRFRKGEDREAVGKGDCIDCRQCVVVCPTGIDIRNGTQLECVNCTACIDACDDIMVAIDKPKGLIRYASEKNIAEGLPFKWTTRLLSYCAVLVILLTAMGFMIFNRGQVEMSFLRTSGMIYQEQPDGRYSNLYNYKIINKTNHAIPFELQLEGKDGELKFPAVVDSLPAQGVAEGVVFIILEQSEIDGIKTKLSVQIVSEGEVLDDVSTNFLGPAF